MIVIESFADGLAGKGKQINTTLDSLSRALTALNQGRGDFFAVVHSLALFVNALHKDDQQFVALNKNLAQFTDKLTGSDRDLANAIQQFDGLLGTLRPFLAKNREVLAHDIDNLANVTTTLVQPEPLNGLETGLHVLPTLETNLSQIYHPSHGAVVSIPAIPNFTNPMQFICSMIQAGSRLGYQESAELCAQYLAPILDAIKFNYLPVRRSTCSAPPRRCPRKSPTPSRGCSRRTDTRTPRFPGSGCPTPRCRTATPSPAGLPRRACRARRWGRSRRAC